MSHRAAVWPPHADLIGAAGSRHRGPLPPVCRPPGHHGRNPAPLALRPLSSPVSGSLTSAHLGGSPLPPSSNHECSSQETQAVLNPILGLAPRFSSGVFVFGSMPQKLSFR